tara:strand:+ start:84 stop:1157 length:1074 start_codon:yes stop_codon:yes gene_type:complete
MLLCEKSISDSIEETIRKLLPVENILREYLGKALNTENEDIESIISTNEKNTLRKLVQRELNSVNKNDLNEGYSHYKIDPDNESINIIDSIDLESTTKVLVEPVIDSLKKTLVASTQATKVSTPLKQVSVEPITVETVSEPVKKIFVDIAPEVKKIFVEPVLKPVTNTPGTQKQVLVTPTPITKVSEPVKKIIVEPITKVLEQSSGITEVIDSTDVKESPNIYKNIEISDTKNNESKKPIICTIEKYKDVSNPSNLTQFSVQKEDQLMTRLNIPKSSKVSTHSSELEELDELDELENYQPKYEKPVTTKKEMNTIDQLQENYKVNKIKSHTEIREMLVDSIEHESRRKKFANVNLFK